MSGVFREDGLAADTADVLAADTRDVLSATEAADGGDDDRATKRWCSVLPAGIVLNRVGTQKK